MTSTRGLWDLPQPVLDLAQRANGWVAERSVEARSLWAKSGDGVNFLTLPEHLRDSACAASMVFHVWLSDSIKGVLAGNLGLSVKELEILVLWLAASHDLGKGVRKFQCQIELREDVRHLVSRVRDAGLSLDQGVDELNVDKLPHSVASGVIIRDWLEETRGFSRRSANSVAAVADAHHGIPSEQISERVALIIAQYPPAWRKVHSELLEATAKLTDVDVVLNKLRKKGIRRARDLQLLTGLVVMSDWIASNEDAFSLSGSDSQVERVEQAARAVQLTEPWHSVSVASVDVDVNFRQAFGWPSEYSARPVQKAMVDSAKKTTGPVMMVLEAETGAGKTEAALQAARVLAAKAGAQGLYFAAPTMATANGLLDRTVQWAKNTTDQQVRSMYLAHSKNSLSQPFQDLKIRDIESERSDGSGAVVALQWLSGRRRGLLSNIVVGTIDQVLMMALQQRYSMLRHIALAGKVVVFDEVHSFDLYSTNYLKTTLSWLSYYGASVIVMSATLPPARRKELLEAYSDGKISEVEDPSYPLITVATPDEVTQIPVEEKTENEVVEVSFIEDDLDTLSATVTELVGQGGCLLVIVNTIARAQAAYQQLCSSFPGEVELHHAGFIAWQRSEKEDRLRAELGPHAHMGSGRPWRKVVVATQVAEQSLDIDADVLITDIAPMDLVIQRAGRIHRHRRPEGDRPSGLRTPQVFIRGILERDPAPVFDGGASAIYGDALLLATLATLPDSFQRPADVPDLVRQAYAEDWPVPEAWTEAVRRARNEDLAKKKRAESRSASFRIPPPDTKKFSSLFQQLVGDSAGARSAGADGERGAAMVRDAEPTVEAIPVIATEYGYLPFGTDTEISSGEDLPFRQARMLATGTVRLPTRMTRRPQDFDAVVTKLEQSTPATWQQSPILRGQLALELDEEGRCELGRFKVQYTSELGIEILSDGSEGRVQ